MAKRAGVSRGPRGSAGSGRGASRGGGRAAAPADGAALLRQGVERHRAGDVAGAATLYRKAVRAAPRLADAHRLLGEALAASGSAEEASRSLRRAMTLGEGQTLELARASLARVLASEDRHEECAEVWRSAAEAEPARPDLRRRRASSLIAGKMASEAMAVLRETRAMFPGDAGAAIDLAVMLDRVGEEEEAASIIGPLVSADPPNPRAAVLAARTARASGDAEGAAGLAELALAGAGNQRVDGSIRGALLIERGLALDALGRAPEAFRCFVQGQAVLRSGLPEGRRDTRPHLAAIEHVLERTTAELVGGWSSATPELDAGDTPIFVVGFPRSGTTLLEQMLSAHPRLAVSDERPALQRVRAALPERFGLRGGYPDALGAMSEKQLRGARRAYLDAARRGVPGGARIVDKHPLNTYDLVLVRRLFPTSPVVFVSRDPRDVCLSCFMQAFTRGLPHLFDLKDTATLYDATMRLYERYREALGLSLLEVRYEELVREPRPTLERVLAHAGEPWDDVVLRSESAEHRRYISTPTYRDVRRGVYTSSVGRWERYREPMAGVLATLEPWAERFGAG